MATSSNWNCVSKMNFRRWVSGSFLFLPFGLIPLMAVQVEKRQFDVNAGEAVKTLQLAALQGEVEIVFTDSTVQGIITQPIEGLYTTAEALSQMVKGTQLKVVTIRENAAFVVQRFGKVPDRETQSQNNKPIEMKIKKKNWLTRLLTGLTAAAAVTSTSPIQAQDSKEENVYDLSPFTVSESENEGYLATQTLAGTRIKSNLRDLGASISVVTKEFLEDTGVTNAGELLIYTVGTEAGGPDGNFSRDSINSANGATRFRALGAPDFTRDYFLTSIPLDTYNTSRVEINRGANSILFGLGSPAGILNYSTLMPTFGGNGGEINLRLDEHGSVRTSLDYNHELIEDKLAVRIAVLNDNTKYKQEPAFQDQDRIFGTVTWKPTESTTLRINSEHGTIKANRPRAIAPREAISAWLLLGNPIYDLTVLTSTPDNSFRSHGAILNKPLAQGGVPWVLPAGRTVDLGGGNVYDNSFFNGNQPVWPAFASQWTTQLSYSGPQVTHPDGSIDPLGSTDMPNATLDGLSRPHPLDFDQDGLEALFFMGVRPFVASRWGTGVEETTFQDRRSFDFVNNLLSGDSSFSNSEFTSFNVALSQLFFEDKSAGFELAFDGQESSYQNSNALSAGNSIFIDINPYLPVTVGGIPTDANSPQSKNPNYLRPFVRSEADFHEGEDERSTFRATVFYEFNFEDHMDSDLGAWLGRHVLTGLYNNQSLKSRGEDKREYWTDPLLLSQGNRTINHQTKVGRYIYLGDPVPLDATSFSDVTINRLNGVKLYNPGAAATVTHFYPGVQPGTVNTRAQGNSLSGAEAILAVAGADGFGNIMTRSVIPEFVTEGGIIEDNAIDSKAINLQSYLLKDNLVGTIGYREDDVEIFRNSSFPTDAIGRRIMAGSSAFDATPLVASSDSLTWSLVGYVPKGIKLPGDSKLSFHYGESENFQTAGLRIDELGNQLGVPAGETMDYGFVLSTLKDKLFVKVNRYETSILNQTIGLVSADNGVHLTARWNAQNARNAEGDGDGGPANLAAVKLLDDAFNWIFDSVDPVWKDLYQFEPQVDGLGRPTGESHSTPSGRGDTQALAAKGTEVEVVYNPTSNWRIAFNVAKQEAVRSDVAPESVEYEAWVREFLTAKIPGYNVSLGDLPALQTGFVEFFPNETGNARFGGFDGTQTKIQHFDQETGQNLGNVLSQEGARATDIREWRFNFVTNYSFSQGRLKGLSVGGAYRYQSQQAIGYAPLPSGVNDVTRPIFGDSEENYDLWFDYAMPFFKSAGDWTMGLTIRNVFADEDDFIKINTQPTGKVAQVRFAPQRTIYFTNKFKF